MATYRLLGLDHLHFEVHTTLAQPVEYRVRLDLHSAHERMAFLMNGYEGATTEFLLRLHSSKGPFLDIGANVGLISVPFALAAGESRNEPTVYAVEAISSNVEALGENIALNDLESRIVVIPFGVGDTEKKVEIQVENNLTAGAGTGTANILPESSDYECTRIPLTITTLDSLFESGALPNDVALIKVDTDGYDLFAMQGARALLSKARPIVFGEFAAHCLSWHGQSIEDVTQTMGSLGYKTFMRTHPRWAFTDAIDPTEYAQDLLSVPVERIEECSWCLVASP